MERARVNRVAKSYALIEFEDAESKKKILKNDFRVFGLHLAARLCSIEDLDYKRSIVVRGFPYATSNSDIFDFISKTLEHGSLAYNLRGH